MRREPGHRDKGAFAEHVQSRIDRHTLFKGTALAVVATAPIFVLSLLVQRHFVRGLTLGAVRG